MSTLKTGQYAYYDSCAGFILCRVTSITGTSGIGSTDQTVTLLVVGTRTGPYAKGEEILTNGLHAIPCAAILRRKHGSRIMLYHLETSN